MNCGPSHRPDPTRAEPTRKALFNPWVSKTPDGETILAEISDYLGHDYVQITTRGGRLVRASCRRGSNEFRHLMKAARAFVAR